MSTAGTKTMSATADGVAGWRARAAVRLPALRVTRWQGRYHFWTILLLMAFGALTYYVQHTPLGRLPLFARIAQDPHDLLRTLFLIPLLYAAIAFRIRGSVIGSLAFLAIVMPRPFVCDPFPDSLFRTIAFAAVATVVTCLVAITLNRADREHEKLEQFLSETMDAQESEKKYLARELHDESLQRLIDVSHEIDDLMEPEDSAELRKLKLLREDVNTVLTGIRGFIMGLRPPLLDEMGLESSLGWLVHETSHEGTQVEFEVSGEPRRLGAALELNLYRIAQEALQNVKKHAHATQTTIRLNFRGDRVQLMVKDNGLGMPAVNRPTGRTGFGLIGMAERARVIGGDLRIDSSPGKGTLVFVEAPLGAESHATGADHLVANGEGI